MSIRFLRYPFVFAISAVLLNAPCTWAIEDDDMAELSEDPIQFVVDVLNEQDAEYFVGEFRPELQKLVDEVLIDSLIQHTAAAHGELSAPDNSEVQITDGEESGTKIYRAKLECEHGKLTIQLTILDDEVLGFEFHDKDSANFVGQIYEDLLADEDDIVDAFTQFYAPRCEAMIHHIFEGKDASVIRMFHPEIQAKVGKKQFKHVFNELRKVGELVSAELQDSSVEMDENGEPQFFVVTHLVSGDQGESVVTHKLQFFGLKGFFTGIVVPLGTSDPESTVDIETARSATKLIQTDAASE